MEEGTDLSQIKGIVPIDQVRAALKKRAVNTNCFKCGVDDWMESSSDEFAGVGLAVISARMVMTSNHIPAVVLGCRNCGTVWLISRQILKEIEDAE